jgi:hypothetical protein
MQRSDSDIGPILSHRRSNRWTFLIRHATATRRASRARRPLLGADRRHGRCDGCTQYTVVHTDGYCTTCRVQLGLLTRRAAMRAA